MKTDSFNALLTEACNIYPDLDYHNFAHALAVQQKVDVLTDNNASDALCLAAIWHDAVYFPGAKNGVNENASSAALTYAWVRLNINEPVSILHEANRLIEGTHVNNHMINFELEPETDLARLLDADLGSLAAPYSRFEEIQFDILRENLLDPESKTIRQRSVNFLYALTNCREYIYHTPKGRMYWEKTARENINLFIENHRK